MRGHLVQYQNWLKIPACGKALRVLCICCLFLFFSSPGILADNKSNHSTGAYPDHPPVEPDDRNLITVAVLESSYSPESLYLEARDGFLLHVSRYRPVGEITLAVILIHDWSMAGLSCWGLLPDSLASAGFDVLIPDLRGHGLSIFPDQSTGETLPPTKAEMTILSSDALIWLDLIEDSVERVGIMCVGRSGELVPPLVRQDSRVYDLAWVSPAKDQESDLWQIPHAEMVRFLFISSQMEIESSVLAGDLFSRFNATAQLRLFNRGQGGCGLIRSEGVRAGLVHWLMME